MVNTQAIVNDRKRHTLNTHYRLGFLRLQLRILLYKWFVYIFRKNRRNRNE